MNAREQPAVCHKSLRMTRYCFRAWRSSSDMGTDSSVRAACRKRRGPSKRAPGQGHELLEV